jgi:hypothetical protein
MKGGTKTLEWTAAAEEAFQSAKCLLAAVLPLQHPAPNTELSLATDASDSHTGGVMQQKSGDHRCPFDFFSKKLNSTEFQYSTFDRELLAAYLSICHFCHFCEGRQFQLYTDHKPLVTALSRVTPPQFPAPTTLLGFYF